jgi:hypothetical protein
VRASLQKTLGISIAGTAAASATAKAAALTAKSTATALTLKLTIAVVAVGAVGVVGATAHVRHRALQKKTAAIANTQTVARPETETNTETETNPETGRKTEPEKKTTPLPPVAAPAKPPAYHSLKEERALLQRARVALAAGDADGALAILDRHPHQFRDGQLGEERDSLRVQALAASGDRDTARRLAVEFEKHHPHSLFLPAVRAARDGNE